MKIQIVNIEPHDDYGSIRDKLLWAKAQRAVLVWPGRGTALNRRLDLVMLKRLGQQRGIAIGLLTFDPYVQAIAQELSIPLFEELEHLPESNWSIWQPDSELSYEERSPREINRPESLPAQVASPRNPTMRFLVFLLPITFLLLAFVLLIPSVEIQLHPATLREFESLTFTLAERSDASKLELSFYTRELEIQGEHRIPTHGEVSLPDEFAHGDVVFTNRTDQPLTIPSGTSVRSSIVDGPYFRTERTVQMEAGEGAQIIVNVTSATAGPDGNLATETIDSIDGPIGLSLSVTNPEPLLGGSLQTRPAVSARDKMLIQQELEQILLARLLAQLPTLQTPPEHFLASSLEIDEKINTEFDADIGDVADSLGLKQSIRAVVAIVDLDEIQQQATRHFENKLPPGYLFVPGSPEILEVHELENLEDQYSTMDVDLGLRTYRDVDLDALRVSLRGSPPDRAMDQLEAIYSLTPSPEISLSPSWFPWLPFIENKINISLVWVDSQ